MSLPRGSGIVLLADDDLAILKMTGRVLEFAGYTPLTTTAIETTLETLRSQEGKVHAILLDLNMPGMEGRATIDEIRRIQPEVPILIITGRTEEETLKHLGDDIEVGYLEKPFQLPELIRKIQDLTGEA